MRDSEPTQKYVVASYAQGQFSMTETDAYRRHRELRLVRPTRVAKPRLNKSSRYVLVANRSKVGQSARDYHLDRWTSGKLSDIDLCTTAWHHTSSGGLGMIDLSVNPRSLGRNHARKGSPRVGLEGLATTRVLHLPPRLGLGYADADDENVSYSVTA